MQEYYPGPEEIVDRELDAEIAEKIFGLKVFKEPRMRRGVQVGIIYSINNEPEYWDDAGEKHLLNPLPYYSSNISYAFEVFKCLPNGISLDKLTNDLWIVHLVHAPTASRAICLAALKLVK